MRPEKVDHRTLRIVHPDDRSHEVALCRYEMVGRLGLPPLLMKQWRLPKLLDQRKTLLSGQLAPIMALNLQTLKRLKERSDIRLVQLYLRSQVTALPKGPVP